MQSDNVHDVKLVVGKILKRTMTTGPIDVEHEMLKSNIPLGIWERKS
jgi:hypothetical protein